MSLLTKKMSLGGLFRPPLAESETPRFGRDAWLDWQRICIAFLILNALSVGANAFMYARINKGELFLVDKKEGPSLNTLDTFELEQTVGFLGEKETRFESLKRAGLQTTDPFVPKR